MSSLAIDDNPLLQDWESATPFGVPPFARIRPEHFEPALRLAMQRHLEEVRTIASNAESPSFDNTVAALDRAGSLLSRVCETFENLCSSHGVPALQAVELKMAAPLAAHHNAVMTTPGLFARIEAVYAHTHTETERETEREGETERLTHEQRRLVERFHLDFVRAGAKFSQEMQETYGKITEELAELSTKFTQNVMADEGEVYLELTSDEDKAGLPVDLVRAGEQAAKERNLPDGACIVTLSRSLVEPFLTYSTRRDLREKAWRLWTKRGELSEERSNHPIATRMLELRKQQAKMHGYENFAEFSTVDTMAGSPQRVMQLLEEVWGRAKESAARERESLEAFVRESQAEGEAPLSIEPWDWRFYAERVRNKHFDLDNAAVKPYFPLSRMVEAIFDCAQRLFGLRFIARPDIVAYHEDVLVYEVQDERARTVAIFLHDNFARPHKRSGAWMSSFRVQHRNTDNGNGDGESVIPIVINNNNFNKPAPGEACLLSFDDAVTLFHEFGHGLHGMLSDVHYRRLSGTSVLKDFVELPSQLYEHWLSEPSVLATHARHVTTNESIPAATLERLMKARKFNQGFQTVEYAASALLDIYLHRIAEPAGLDLRVFEEEMLAKLGMPQGIVMRHRLPHFQHLFSGEFYASGYYVYLWAEVLDADGYEAFTESGDCFDKQVAQRVKQFIYSAGNSKDPAELYRLFRGRDPVIEPMLRKKGLL